MSAERLLSKYDEELVRCTKMIKALEVEINLIKTCYDKGILKSKRIRDHHIKMGENKKSEYLDKQDEYFRRMDLLKRQHSAAI